MKTLPFQAPTLLKVMKGDTRRRSGENKAESHWSKNLNVSYTRNAINLQEDNMMKECREVDMSKMRWRRGMAKLIKSGEPVVKENKDKSIPR